MQKLLLSFSLLVLCASIVHAQYYPERNNWETRTPAQVGMSAAAVDSAVAYALANEYSGQHDLRLAILEGFAREPDHQLLGPTRERGGPAGMILKDGYVVAQWGDVERVDMTFSVTKSYLSTMAGLALEDGLIEDLQDPVAHYVWDGTFKGDHNQKINWQHLLHQTSDWSGTLFGLNDWADRPARDQSFDEWRYRELHEPGTNYKYNDVRVNVLAYSLLQVWRKPLPQVLKERIMDPIEASTTWRWYGYENTWVNIDGVEMQSVSGGGHHGGGVFISTLDHARFGLLFARQGRWRDRQLIAADWTKSIQTPTPANVNYGYMWWLNSADGDRHWPNVPEHVYYAAGFGGNFIIVDEQRDLVLVTRWLQPRQIGEFVSQVYTAFE